MEVKQPANAVCDRPIGRYSLNRTAIGLAAHGVELEGAIHDADIDADIAPCGGACSLANCCACVGRVLEGLPRDLQEQPFLWIHRCGFPVADREVEGVEQINAVEEGSTGASRCLPTVGRDLTKGRFGIADHRPEVFWRCGPREAAGEADDCYVIVVDVRGVHRLYMLLLFRVLLYCAYLGAVVGSDLGCQGRDRAELEQQCAGQWPEMRFKLAQDLGVDETVDAKDSKRLIDRQGFTPAAKDLGDDNGQPLPYVSSWRFCFCRF